MHFIFSQQISLSLGKKQQKILILFQSEEKDIMALLPDNQSLISSILFNKPFQPFLKMSDEEQTKLVNILEKVLIHSCIIIKFEI
jgi:hypothetical protein